MGKWQKICYWLSLCASVVLLVAFTTCLVVHFHSDPAQERDQCREQLKNETSALEGQVARARAEGTVLQAALAKANQTLQETCRGWESCQALTVSAGGGCSAGACTRSRGLSGLRCVGRGNDPLPPSTGQAAEQPHRPAG